jgi:hypothetical protein
MNTLHILANVVAALSVVVAGVSGLMTPVCFVVMVVGLFQAAARRREGVPYYVAIISRNIIFRPDLYTESAARPRRLHVFGLMGLMVLPFVGIAATLLATWLGQ